MAHKKRSGWQNQTKRHSNARKYGRAGGKYAKPKKRFKTPKPVQRTKPKKDFVSKIIAYESDEMTSGQEQRFFSELIKSGQAWTLQGHYGRVAKYYIDSGLIDEKGKILKSVEKEVKKLAQEIDDTVESQKHDAQVVAESLKEYDLEPRYDSRASFYGKAKVEAKDRKLTLMSYGTKVAEIDQKTGVAKVFGLYSNTTTRHIKEFLKQQGFVVESGKQIMETYGSAMPKEKDVDMLKTTGMVAMMGEVIGGKTKKEKNEWKLRMLKAGMGKGFNVPDDWNKLSESEKEKRLNKVIAVTQEKNKMRVGVK